MHLEIRAHPTKTWGVTVGVEGKGISGRENSKADPWSQKKKEHKWTSLAVQWLKICLPAQGGMGSSSGLGRFHKPQNNLAYAPELGTATTEPTCHNY